MSRLLSYRIPVVPLPAVPSGKVAAGSVVCWRYTGFGQCNVPSPRQAKGGAEWVPVRVTSRTGDARI